MNSVSIFLPRWFNWKVIGKRYIRFMCTNLVYFDNNFRVLHIFSTYFLWFTWITIFIWFLWSLVQAFKPTRLKMMKKQSERRKKDKVGATVLPHGYPHGRIVEHATVQKPTQVETRRGNLLYCHMVRPSWVIRWCRFLARKEKYFKALFCNIKGEKTYSSKKKGQKKVNRKR